MVRISPKFKSMPLTCAMKMAARASYRAVPSMFMVAPTGSTKRVIRLSTWLFSSRHLKVMGRVAELRRDTFCHHPLIIIMLQTLHERKMLKHRFQWQGSHKHLKIIHMRTYTNSMGFDYMCITSFTIKYPA